MRAVARVTQAVIGVISCGCICLGGTQADTRRPMDLDANIAAVKQAFTRLAQQKTYQIETKGISGGVKIDSHIQAQFPDHFHILNRGPNASEFILTPEGSFAKTDADSPWRTVPMSYLSIAESMGAKANEKLLKSMRQVIFMGAANCPGGGANTPAKQYQFETDSSEAKASIRTTITVSNGSGLPCHIRAQQPDAGIDTTASYDYASKFIIRAPQ